MKRGIASVIFALAAISTAGLWSTTGLRACEWSYSIWGIRSPSADPLFRFQQGTKVGYIDATGKIVVPPTLDFTGNFFGEFHEGLLAIRSKDGYDYIDRSGRVALGLHSWFAEDFSEGLAVASSDSKSLESWGYIDHTGRFAIPPQFARADPFSDGLAQVTMHGEFNSTGYINKRGEFVIAPRLSYGMGFNEGLAAVINGSPCQMVNGGSCERARFRPIKSNPDYDCKWRFIDKDGEVISPAGYDDANGFSEGLAAVKISQKWGYIDKSARIVIAPEFDSAGPFSEGLAGVTHGESASFIDRSGRTAFVTGSRVKESFSEGLALVADLGPGRVYRYRYVDKTGGQAIQGTFQAATSFHFGLAHVKLDDGRSAWIHKSGKVVFVEDARKK